MPEKDLGMWQNLLGMLTTHIYAVFAVLMAFSVTFTMAAMNDEVTRKTWISATFASLFSIGCQPILSLMGAEPSLSLPMALIIGVVGAAKLTVYVDGAVKAFFTALHGLIERWMGKK